MKSFTKELDFINKKERQPDQDISQKHRKQVKKALLNLSLCGLDQRGKALRVINCHLGQHLAVQVDAGALETEHKLAVGQTVEACCRVDTGNPDTAELALALTAACVCRSQRAHHGLLSHAILLGTRSSVALSQL